MYSVPLAVASRYEQGCDSRPGFSTRTPLSSANGPRAAFSRRASPLGAFRPGRFRLAGACGTAQICRTHPARPVQSAEAAPGAGNKLPWEPRRRNAIRCWAKHAKSHREQIHHRLSSQYAVNGAFTRLMDASHGRVHRYRAKALAHPGIDAGACSTNSVHPDDVGFD